MKQSHKPTSSDFRILNERTEVVPIDSVRPHPRNVNKSDLDSITESERQHGFYGSLTVQKSTGYIIAGTHRWLAAKELAAAEIPVTFIDVDDDAAKRQARGARGWEVGAFALVERGCASGGFRHDTGCAASAFTG